MSFDDYFVAEIEYTVPRMIYLNVPHTKDPDLMARNLLARLLKVDDGNPIARLSTVDSANRFVKSQLGPFSIVFGYDFMGTGVNGYVLSTKATTSTTEADWDLLGQLLACLQVPADAVEETMGRMTERDGGETHYWRWVKE